MNPIIEKIKRLYEENPEAAEEYKRDSAINLDVQLEGLEKILTVTNFEIDDWENYSIMGSATYSIAGLLVHLPPKIVYEKFGEKIFLWTLLNHSLNDKAYRGLYSALPEVVGIDQDLFEKARLSAWRLLSLHDLKTVLSFKDIIEGITKKEILKEIDLPSLLTQCWKGNGSISEKRVKDYALTPLTTAEPTHDVGYEKTWGVVNTEEDNTTLIWLDAPVGLGLMYTGRPNAVTSFIPTNQRCLMIYQLQGVTGNKSDENVGVRSKYSARGLMPIDWQKLIVEATENVAKRLGYQEISIRSGHHNPWIRPYRDGKIHLPLERALVAYDAVAERLGFEKRLVNGDVYGDWYKPVSN